MTNRSGVFPHPELAGLFSENLQGIFLVLATMPPANSLQLLFRSSHSFPARLTYLQEVTRANPEGGLHEAPHQEATPL